MKPASRREFLKATSAGAAALTLTATSYARVAGSNERLSIGVIGCGDRGLKAHMPGVNAHAKAANLEITAVCDPWSVRREMAAAQCREWYGRAARKLVSYRELVALEDVDAVMIASPDHWHTTHLEAAAKARKDVYCEKPLAMDLEKLKSACDAVRASGVVFQAGTQVRSLATSTGCRKVFHEGALGKISRVEQCRNGTEPYWYRYLKDAKPQDVDWKEFLGEAPTRPFRADLFTGWYGYREFSGGPVPGFGSHFIDLMNYIVGSKFPTSAVCLGGTFTWRDEHQFTCPDHVQALWVYPEGFLVSYTTNFGNGGGDCLRICGDQGTLDLTPWTAPTVSSAGAAKKGKLGKQTPVQPIDGPDHFLDWLQCIRSRKECRAPIDAGYQHAVAVILAMRAYDTGRRLVYDAENGMALFYLGYAYAEAGSFGEAIEAFERAAAATGGMPWLAELLAWARGSAGRRAPLRAALADAEQRARAGYVPPTAFALLHLGLGDDEGVLRWLERGLTERDAMMVWIKHMPCFDRLHAHPTFERLLAGLRLA